ncbi:MAG TPA: SepM family pheromone-processing serine protease [Bacillaceae bacterium]
MKSAFRHQIWNKAVAGLFLFLILLLFIPTPYYLFQPGSVEELRTKVDVEDGVKSAEGNLYLTTVLSIRASNIYYLAYGLFAPNTEVRKVEEVRGDLSDAEYDVLLKHMMSSSQFHALAAGFKAAGEKVEVAPKGVFVRSVLDSSDAKGKLKVGDVIHKVDGHPVRKASDFLEYLSGKKAGETVELQFSREEAEKTEDVRLIELKNGANKAGVGIVPEDQFEIDTSRKVKIDAADIGGPSAGLMFSLEIYDQLTEGNLTKGYEVAGTGTIDQDGHVGQIGGIKEKIAAVHKAGVDIFFCPADIHPGDTNEKDVKAEASKHGYYVKIVPVATMKEAIEYLDRLPLKK